MLFINIVFGTTAGTFSRMATADRFASEPRRPNAGFCVFELLDQSP